MLHYSKLNAKAPRVGSVVQWHQDFAFYPHSNTDLVAALIYLDDATPANACGWRPARTASGCSPTRWTADSPARSPACRPWGCRSRRSWTAPAPPARSSSCIRWSPTPPSRTTPTGRLLLAAAEFNSLFEIQEGAHLASGRKAATGYLADEAVAEDPSALATAVM